MSNNRELQPEVMVFAGPNGSGKSTITRMAKTVGVYINADDIKKSNLLRSYLPRNILWLQHGLPTHLLMKRRQKML